MLANWNEVTLILVAGHCGIPGNEKADELARQGAAMTPLGPEPALRIPRCSAREATKKCTKLIKTAGSASWRLQHHTLLFAAARPWLASAKFHWEVLCTTKKYKHGFIKRPVSLCKRHSVN